MSGDLTVYDQLDQGTPEWHDARRGLVTASTVGRLITTRTRTAIEYGCQECSAFPFAPCVGKRDGAPIKTAHPSRADAARLDTSPAQLVPADTEDARSLTWLLVAERITGWTDPTFTTDDMWRGHEIEPIARDAYAEHTGRDVAEVGFMVLEREGFRLGYSPDGLVGYDGLIEVKAPRAKTHLRTILSGEVPEQHMPQIQAGLLVSGRAWCDFISYCGGMPMFTRRVKPDPRWFAVITAAVERFEQTAVDMRAAYDNATRDLPPTERINLDVIV